MHARDDMHETSTQDVDVLAALHARIKAYAAEVDRFKNEIRTLTVERDLYKERVLAQQRALFAAKSEQRAVAQRDLFFNEAEALAPSAGEPEAKKVEIARHARVLGKRGRKPLDPALPREVVRHELPQSERVCPQDGTVLREIGVEVSEQLDIIPAQVRVIRHERVKYACACCGEGLRTAPAPAKLLAKGLLTEGALAWVITAKYQDALPLYRQAALLNRFGGDIARNSLAYAVLRVGEAVQPMVNLLRDELLEAKLLQGDETELQVLKEDGRAASAKSWLWLQMSAGNSPPVRLFTYSPSRSAKTALDLYQGARGALLSDGYEVYAAVAQDNGLTHLGCWAHARRRFVEAEALVPKPERRPEHPATRMLELIGGLYAIEQRVRDKELTPEAHLALRQSESAAVIARIQTHLQAHLHATLPQSLLGRALHYLAGEWPKLVRFLEDARYPLDNNAAENAIRPFVIGRKNWLFSDTVAGARASANLYSLIETAKANGIEPYHYLRELFIGLPRATCLADYEALLPWKIGKH
jgi:transposase